MKLLPLLAIPLGFIALAYGVRGKSLLLQGEQGVGVERAVTVGGGLLLLMIGFGYGLLVFRLFFR